MQYIIRPDQIDYMFHGFSQLKSDQGGRQKNNKIKWISLMCNVWWMGQYKKVYNSVEKWMKQ